MTDELCSFGRFQGINNSHKQCLHWLASHGLGLVSGISSNLRSGSAAELPAGTRRESPIRLQPSSTRSPQPGFVSKDQGPKTQDQEHRKQTIHSVRICDICLLGEFRTGPNRDNLLTLLRLGSRTYFFHNFMILLHVFRDAQNSG